MTKPTPLPASVTDELWMRMASRYGHAWVSQYGASPAGIAAAEWRSTLAGLTSKQINIGFDDDKLRGSEWPPSSTRFYAMCMDIPTLPEVAHRYRNQQFSACPFDRLVYQYLDAYRWRNAPVDKADRLLRDAYDMARDHVLAGDELPAEPVASIEAPKAREAKPASPEVAAAHIAKMAELLKTEPVKPHTEVDA
jgi:hypothetical protein